jgi:hypothetical protein
VLAQPSLTFALGDYLYSHQYTNVTIGALHLYDSCFLSLHFCSIGRPIPLSLSLSFSMCVSCVRTCFSIARIWVEYLVLNFCHISLFEVLVAVTLTVHYRGKFGSHLQFSSTWYECHLCQQEVHHYCHSFMHLWVSSMSSFVHSYVYYLQVFGLKFMGCLFHLIFIRFVISSACWL